MINKRFHHFGRRLSARFKTIPLPPVPNRPNGLRICGQCENYTPPYMPYWKPNDPYCRVCMRNLQIHSKQRKIKNDTGTTSGGQRSPENKMVQD